MAEGEDEISRLVQEFCRMKASTRENIRNMEEKHAMEQKLNDMRLQMLKSQINPHFLFNTLNMIASTAQIEDAVATEKMITALSRLFRYNLKSAGTVMPLERELKHLTFPVHSPYHTVLSGQSAFSDTYCPG